MGSAYREAVRNDPRVVERVLALDDDDAVGQWRPQGADWSLRDEMTATLIDRLGQLLAVEAARGSGKKAKSPAPYPRPLRAVDLARAEAESRYLAELDDDVEAAQARWLKQQEAQGVTDGQR